MTSKHAIVHGRWLCVSRRVKLIHLHRVRVLRRALCLRRLRRPLLACRFGLLLLLNARWHRFAERRVFQIHRRHKWPRKLLLGNEGVKLGLLW